MKITEMIEIPGHVQVDTHTSSAGTRGEGQVSNDIHRHVADAPSKLPGHRSPDTHVEPAGTADQGDSEIFVRPKGPVSLLVGQMLDYTVKVISSGDVLWHGKAESKAAAWQAACQQAGVSGVADEDIAIFSPLIVDIREEHRLREDYRRAAASLHLRMCAIIRRVTGCAKSQAPVMLKQVFAPHPVRDTQAEIEGEGDGQDPNMDLQPVAAVSPARLYPLLAPMYECREPLLACQKSYEKTLIKMAKQLPIWPWVESVRGFGALALAQIVGEAGDISDYENPAKLWKRMGLAVIGGEKQGKHIDAEKAKAHGYSPKRRAVSWNLGGCLIKLNDGKYRAYYDKEKARQMVKLELPEDKPGHAHKRAQRHMEKLLLKDFWLRWNQKAAENPKRK